MSFSSKAKNELARRTSDSKCCQMAELSALVRVSGTIQLRGLGKTDLLITTENPAIGRMIFVLFKRSMRIHTDLEVVKNNVLRKNNSYQIKITDATDILKRLEIMVEKDDSIVINNGLPKKLIEDECCRRAYIRGVFLGGGSLSDPEKSYHLELITHREDYANELKDLINSYNLHARVIARKKNFIVYLKEGDQIVDLLNIIGAHTALMSFENVRIVKSMRNNINRLVNCETANLNKMVNAAVKQKKHIEIIEQYAGLDSLPDGLKEIAMIRLNNTDLSLKELGEMLSPPIGKSGVNHRMKKIEKIALDIIDKEAL
ncbi:DNA-binding protein WhiA [Acidaminobacter sp. JC074]|uniref:DNA-binding protein WhiA n=1 Tax=Acidaminobacter sp. JC074 TaxID=2530199 RepID=UPI001F0CED2F|nr:DNA-binding protein WhiA [Acidaminobacter sp. JC074]MCH4888971.1 DNA-binding protein WhiA [Acidaminobacter sp. JC074]